LFGLRGFYKKKNLLFFQIKLASALPENYDVKIFQDLPLFVQKEVLKGKLIYVEDEVFVYETAFDTIKKFEDFKKGYYDYIDLEKIK